jgi:hypothetical protein
MTKILAGNWWKFDRYELRDGMIRPARGAKLSRYDPWEHQNPATPLQQDRVPAYRSLLDIVNRLKYLESPSAQNRFGRLHPRSERELLDWCGRHGLLGLLLHDALLITLAPHATKISAGDYRAILKSWRQHGVSERPPRTAMVQKSYTRTTFGWVERDQPIHRETHLQTPAVVTQDYVGERLAEQSLVMLRRYFPSAARSNSPDAWQTFDCPAPLSDRFWMLYAESLDDFLSRTRFLRLAIASMTARTVRDPTSVEAVELMAGRDYLQGLLSPVGFGFAVEPGVGLRPRLVGSSLLSILAAMALQDAPRGRVLQCDACGNIFIAGKRTQTRYCSKRCRATAQKRAVRKRAKGGRQGRKR